MQSPDPCIGFLVGLYGAWPEANRIVAQLRLSRKREPIQLDQVELRELILVPGNGASAPTPTGSVSTYWKLSWEIARTQVPQ